MSLQSLHRQFVSGPGYFVAVFVLLVTLRFFEADTTPGLRFWAVAALQLFNALYVNTLISHFRIVRLKTWMPALLYSLFSLSQPALMLDMKGALVVTILLSCIYLFQTTYQSADSQQASLFITILLTAGSFLWPPLLYFIPLSWLGMILFRSLTIRTIVATFLGIVTVAAFLFTYGLIRGNPHFVLEHLPEAAGLIDFRFRPFLPLEWINTGVLFLCFLLSGSNLYSAGISESVRAILSLKNMFGLGIICFVVLLLQRPWYTEWTAILSLLSAILLSHLFSLHSKRGLTILFFVILVFFPTLSCLWGN